MQEVRRLRQERGWTQTQLAFHSDLAPSVISQIENDKRNPSASTLRKLAGAFDVEVADLFPKGQSTPPLDAAPKASAEPRIWEESEKVFVAWLEMCSDNELEKVGEELHGLLREYQQKYYAPHHSFPSQEAVIAHANSEEGQRGRLLHRRTLQVIRTMRARMEAEAERLKAEEAKLEAELVSQ